MRRKDKIFGHKLWMTPIASYIGLLAIILGIYQLLTGIVSLWWIMPMLFCTFLILMGITVGFHRLFCHSSFGTSNFWHLILAYLGNIAIYGSSIQWTSMHMTHHKYSDTEKDPHYTGIRYILWKENKPTEFNRRTLSRLYRNPLHKFFHNYYILPIIITIVLLSSINLTALLYCYLIPLGWLHFVGGFHQVFAHNKTGPLNLPLLEIPLFTGGEWCHKHHHEYPKDPRFGELDAGYYLIKFIKNA